MIRRFVLALIRPVFRWAARGTTSELGMAAGPQDILIYAQTAWGTHHWHLTVNEARDWARAMMRMAYAIQEGVPLPATDEPEKQAPPS